MLAAMRHKARLALGIALLAVVMGACGGGGPSEADIEATVVARVEAISQAVPTDTPVPPTPTSTHTPTPTPTLQTFLIPLPPTPTPRPTNTPIPTATPGQSEAVMISGNLLLPYANVNTSLPNEVTPCEQAEKLLSLNTKIVTGPGYGAAYSDDGDSWIGIKSAALCTGAYDTIQFPASYVSAAGFGMIGQMGLGLVVEVDLSKLPSPSIERCSFTVAQQHIRTPASVGDTGYQLPLASILKLGVIGTSGFVSVVTASQTNSVTVPRPDVVYNIQGICAK